MADSDRDHRLDHIVVVMFENRSFDNLLGYLYQHGEVPSFEGIAGRTLANPIPPDLPDAASQTIPVHPASNMDTPDPDPGEEHPHTNTQLFGTVLPDSNRLKEPAEMQAPFNAPPDPTAVPPMNGFVADYANAFHLEMGRWPRYDELAQIMACYTPDRMPVINALARGFAVFDHWFCEVPSQTYTNRSFFHAASSSGFVLNSPGDSFPVHNDAETIFERLDAAKRTWRVYFDRLQVVSATGLIHARRLAPFFATKFLALDDFFDDVAAGKLPTYSFVEPCLIPPHTDMHPPGLSRLRRLLRFPSPSALKGGERFLAKIYNAIRASNSATGSNWKNTLLLVTFDEHGGTYDHVPPPKAAPPDPAAPPGQMGFKFDRSGVRIPAIAVSAWVDPKTVVTSEYRSTSVIRTLRERWSLGPPLTQRDASAADIAPVLSRTTPRPPSEWPDVFPKPVFNLGLWRLARTMSPLGRHLYASAIALEAKHTGRPAEVDAQTASRHRTLRHIRGFEHAAFPAAMRRHRGH